MNETSLSGIRAYARELRAATVAIKMTEDANPATLDAAITWVNHYSGRQDAVSCLGLDRPGVEPMDIGSIPLSAPPPPSPLNEAITQVLRGQERLMTKLA